MNKSAFLTSECTEVDDDDYSRFYMVQLPKKFGAPPASYIPDAPQRLKKRTVGSEQGKSVNEKKKGSDDKQPQEVKLGGYYSPELLPNYLPHEFNLEHDKLVQHNIVDANGELIPCWNNSVQLREGTLILLVITLRTWNIPGTGREGYKNFKRYYTLNTHSVRVLRESWIPEPTVYRRSPPDSENIDTVAISAQDEFDSFTAKKRTETRTASSPQRREASMSKIDTGAPIASSSKIDAGAPITSSSKKDRKKAQKFQPIEFEKAMATDIEMDTSV